MRFILLALFILGSCAQADVETFKRKIRSLKSVDSIVQTYKETLKAEGGDVNFAKDLFAFVLTGQVGSILNPPAWKSLGFVQATNPEKKRMVVEAITIAAYYAKSTPWNDFTAKMPKVNSPHATLCWKIFQNAYTHFSPSEKTVKNSYTPNEERYVLSLMKPVNNTRAYFSSVKERLESESSKKKPKTLLTPRKDELKKEIPATTKEPQDILSQITAFKRNKLKTMTPKELEKWKKKTPVKIPSNRPKSLLEIMKEKADEIRTGVNGPSDEESDESDSDFEDEPVKKKTVQKPTPLVIETGKTELEKGKKLQEKAPPPIPKREETKPVKGVETKVVETKKVEEKKPVPEKVEKTPVVAIKKVEAKKSESGKVEKTPEKKPEKDEPEWKKAFKGVKVGDLKKNFGEY